MILQICNNLQNVGDSLAPIITERLTGEKVVKVFKEIPQEYKNQRILAGLGSFLGYYSNYPLSVWGTGFEPGYIDRNMRAQQGSRINWKFYAVRGYLTKKVFNLKDRVLIGDPALLLPEIYMPNTKLDKTKRYFRHYSNKDSPNGLDQFVIHSTRIDPFMAIDLIVNSSFVFTESLHIAIIAFAYNIPWAWSLNKHKRAMFKWFDWFSSIHIAARWFHPLDYINAEKWFHANYRLMKKVDIKKLREIFPEIIANIKLDGY
jgi:hypothetical protein